MSSERFFARAAFSWRSLLRWKRHLTRRGLRHSTLKRRRRLILEHFESRTLLATLVNTGTAADVIYTLPATASDVFLEDDGTSGNGMLRLRTNSGTFDTT